MFLQQSLSKLHSMSWKSNFKIITPTWPWWPPLNKGSISSQNKLIDFLRQDSFFSHSQAPDVGRTALRSLRPHEDLPGDVRSAHRTDAANTSHCVSEGQQQVEDCDGFHQTLPQPRAAPLCQCGRWSVLCAHGFLLLHVRRGVVSSVGARVASF